MSNQWRSLTKSERKNFNDDPATEKVDKKYKSIVIDIGNLKYKIVAGFDELKIYALDYNLEDE